MKQGKKLITTLIIASLLTPQIATAKNADLIASFYATNSTYKTFEKIIFKAKLKEKAYTTVNQN